MRLLNWLILLSMLLMLGLTVRRHLQIGRLMLDGACSQHHSCTWDTPGWPTEDDRYRCRERSPRRQDYRQWDDGQVTIEAHGDSTAVGTSSRPSIEDSIRQAETDELRRRRRLGKWGWR